MGESKKWYALYTRTGYERKISEILTRKRIENYCPFNKLQGNDRKIVNEFLFNSCLFVRITESEQLTLRSIPGVINFLYWLNKPAVINDAEIVMLKKVLRECVNIKLQKIPMKSFIHHQVKLFPANNSLKVILPSLGYVLMAETAMESVKASIRNMIPDANLPYSAHAVNQ